MMKLLPLLGFLFFCNAASANHYYISPGGSDKAAGTNSSPWQSLYMATASATKPGDVIHVLPGTYTELARCVLAPGVSIEGEGENCIIQSTLIDQFVAILILTSPEGTNGNQHISGIKLSGNNLKTSWGIEIRGRSNVSIYNCVIADFDDTGVFWGGRNDNLSAPPQVFATGNSFYKNKLFNCAKYDGFGRGCLTIGGQQGMLIYDNEISQTGRPYGTNGWPVKGGNDGFLKGCKIYNNKITKQPFDGTGWDFAIELFDVSGLEIYGNRIIGSVDLNRQSKNGYAYSVYIHDNVIGPETLRPFIENGIILEYSTETAVISNNQFKNIGNGILFSCRSYSAVTDITIKSNQFNNIGTANGSSESYAVRFISDGSNNHYINNLIIDSNQFIASTNGKTFWGIGINDAVKASKILITNNTLANFSAACITANPAYVIDSFTVTKNILTGNGYGNGLAFTGGTPQNLYFKNNTTADGQVFTTTNIIQNIIRPFYHDLKRTSLLEFIAVLAGILSVWFSRKENIYVYPIGLINTVIYIFLSLDASLFGEASVNFYYTIMSIYGWIIWNKRDKRKHRVVRVTASSKKEIITQLAFFAAIYVIMFVALTFLNENFYPGVIPWADAFASATAFTGMWLMTKKKVESWYWWIATNVASIPLYFVKHFVLTSVYYGVLLVLAVMGLQEWKKRAKTTRRK